MWAFGEGAHLCMVDDGGEAGRALRVMTGEDVHLCVVNDAGWKGPRSVRAIGEGAHLCVVNDGGETGRALRVGTGEDVHLCVVNDVVKLRLQRIHNAMWAFGDRLVRFACVRA